MRYCLGAGYVTMLEGILHAEHYAPMLSRLHADFGGQWYYFDLLFEETVRRHATRPQAAEFGPEQMQGWYRERDFLPFVSETMIRPEQTLTQTVEIILHRLSPSSRQAF